MKQGKMKRTGLKKKKVSEKTLRKQLHDKAWKLMSAYVRKRDGSCVTCGSTNQLQAGHFIHNKMDFNFQNIHAQCKFCNHFKHGNLGKYANFLVKEYGWQILDELEIESNKVVKLSIEDYEAIINNLQYLMEGR